MKIFQSFGLRWMAACCILFWLGCKQEASPPKDSPPREVPAAERTSPGEGDAGPRTGDSTSNEPPSPDEILAQAGGRPKNGGETKKSTPLAPPPSGSAEIAAVLLTEQHRDMCKVFVGDQMPEVELPDLDGDETKLSSLYGAAATVVYFWNDERALALAGLADLEHDVVKNFGDHGVQVVGIAVGETADDVRHRMADAEAEYPQLIDADRSAFLKMGSEKLPRVYFLDSGGKILWFDIEYSRSTRRELLAGLRYVLKEQSF